MKSAVVLLVATMAVFGVAQTQPIQPKTPNVQLPGPLNLPPPKEIKIGQQPLTADEAVAIALKNQPQIAIARANLLSAQGRTEQATSGLLPNFNANGSYTQTSLIRGQSGNTSSGGLFTTSISVDQLLFDFGRTRDSAEQEKWLERSTNHTLTRTQQTVALEVKLAFYNLSESLNEVSISDANVANRQRQLDEAQARLDAGLGAPGDVVSARSSLASAGISLSTARDTALNARVTLAQDLGVDPRTPITPATSTESAPDNEADLERLVESAMNNRPDLRAAEEQVTAAKYAVSFASKGNLPKISASAGVGSRGATDPLATETGVFGINVTWNFFDSGFTDGAVKVARGGEQVARQNLVQVTLQMVADVSQAYVDLQSANQRVTLADVEVQNALEFVRISEGRYTGGIGLFSDITTAQAALVSAQRDQSLAKQEVETARARLKVAIGSP